MEQEPIVIEPSPEKTQVFPQVQKKRSGCFGCLFGCFAVFAVLLLLLLAAVWTFNGSITVWSERLKSNDTEDEDEFVVDRQMTQGKIAVIDVCGVILNENGGYSENADSALICRQLKKAEKDSEVRAVILNLNTPGGEVTASDDIHAAVMQVRKSKPVVALMNSMAASGGYYAAVACDWIVASRLTMTGSIGVIISTYNYKALLDKVGVQSEVYKSGKMKDMLNGARPRTPEEIALVQSLVDECYSEFVRLVAAGRRIPAEKIRTTEIGDGRIFHGSKALKLGLVDELGRMPEAVAKAEKLAGCQSGSLKVVRYKRNNSFFNFLFGTEANAHKALRLSVPGLTEPRLPRGCLYFLPQDYLQ